MIRKPWVAALAVFLAAPGSALAAGWTSVGRDVVVSRPLSGRLLAVASDVRIDAPVSGDVVVWAGDISFGPAGRVDGDVRAFGGRVIADAAGRIPVRGEVSTPGTLLHLYLGELRRAPWDSGSASTTVYGLRILALAGWLAAALGLLFFFSSPLSRAALVVETDWTGTLLAGALGVVTLLLAAAAALALLPAALGVPAALLAGAVAVGAKIFGMGALFLWVGQKLVRSVSPARRPAALAAGFAVCAGVSLLPFVGALAWSAASVVAVGAALLSRFGAPRFRVALARAV